VVARAWTDPISPLAEAGRDGGDCLHGFSGGRASTWLPCSTRPETHNLVVCTLCSCYPWPVLGLPPAWYKSPDYRARAVREPRAVLSEFGVTLPETTRIQVWDSTAEIRYLVIPNVPRHRGMDADGARGAGDAGQHDRLRRASNEAPA
jgi:nitrile hydratase